MRTESQKAEEQTTVRIYKGTKKSLQEVVRKMTGMGTRRVSEIEIADEILSEGLPKLKRKLGIL